MRKCILKKNDPEIGDYYLCTKCKHFMLSTDTAQSHRKCKEKLFPTFEPKEELYRCTSCGRYFDTLCQWRTHDELHKRLGNHDSNKFIVRIDQNNFVVN